MENSVEALKLAFAVFVFVLALSVTFMVISQAKRTADTTLYYTDKTNFQEAYHNGTNIVGVDDLISTLFRYYKESLSITIKDRSGTIIAIFDTGIEIDCTWRGSNSKTLERIKEFVSGNDTTTDYITFNQDFNYEPVEDDEDNVNYHFDNRVMRNVLNTTSVCAKWDLPTFLSNNNENMQTARFKKTLVETTVDGEYHTPSNYTLDGEDLIDDGTTIQITPGTKKVYVTYQLTDINDIEE